MQSNPFLNFQRAAEARGYPALLIVGAAARDEGDPVAARPRRQRPAGQVGHGRKAA